MKNKKLLLLASSVLFLTLTSFKPDEGMFPLSHLEKINFQKAGFKISQEDIFNPNGISLTNALVRIGGCTGSFISDEGLIITNHHCVFGAVSRVSSVENNYLEKGFMANNREEEIPVGIECKITRSYEDVSDKILKGVTEIKDGKLREIKIAKNINDLVSEESKKYKDLKIEISEMFLGRTYVLFRYEILNDTRLVYVPPRQIGEFGGESDNWEWPRHTGDFSIVRAYANKDNKAVNYSKENIPYKPQKFLQINPKGVEEEDLVFILGYPGKTFRHQPSRFMNYQEKHQLAYISDWYGTKINIMMNLSRNRGDEARYLELAGTIKQLANVKKNFEGKLQGLSRTRLVQQKMEEDRMLKAFAKEQNLSQDLQTVLDKLDSIYNIREENADAEWGFQFLRGDVPYFNAAYTLLNLQNQAKELPKNLRDSFWDSKKDVLETIISKNFTLKNHDLQFAFFTELIKKLDAKGLAPQSYVKAKNKDKWLQRVYGDNAKAHKKWNAALKKGPRNLAKAKSQMTRLASELYSMIQDSDNKRAFVNAQLNLLIPIYTELKSQKYSTDFIPDANATLRLTYGYIRRYEPNDGEIHFPLTSAEGVLEKFNTGNPDYFLPDNLRTFFDARKYPEILIDKKTGKPVVCMLYNLDTTGGNSGSPVMDSEGRLVGVNFDRTYTATINDFAWNEAYSRSVAVDIRYVIYIMKYLSGADHILQEIGVNI